MNLSLSFNFQVKLLNVFVLFNAAVAIQIYEKRVSVKQLLTEVAWVMNLMSLRLRISFLWLLQLVEIVDFKCELMVDPFLRNARVRLQQIHTAFPHFFDLVGYQFDLLKVYINFLVLNVPAVKHQILFQLLTFFRTYERSCLTLTTNS